MMNGEQQHATQRIAAVIGMFDGVHLGHRDLLRQLREAAAPRGLAPAVFTFPSHPLSIIRPEAAPALLSTPEEKLLRLTAEGIAPRDIEFLSFDDRLRHLTAREFISLLHHKYNVDYILRGFNNRFGTERDLSAEDYRAIAAAEDVTLSDALPYSIPSADGPQDVSSSLIRIALAGSDMPRAAILLGYPYEISGTIEPGKHLGATIGFPTANIAVAPSKLIPPQGVYACTAETDGASYPAVVNIGHCPTTGTLNGHPTIEAHLIGYSGQLLYGKTMQLRFHNLLRREQKFNSLHDLQSAIASDIEKAKNLIEMKI